MGDTQASKPFETERTRRWRGTDLEPDDARTIRHIEEFGCSVISVEDDNQALSWSYSIGNFDVCGKPEVITIGLKSGPGDYLVNEASRQLREGTDLANGRHRELLGEVEVEFRPVDPKWIKPLMGWARWYYEGKSFPVLQAVYPDLQNRFPGEPDFDERFAQPLLQPDAPVTQREQDFWASNDPASSLFNWPFEDGPHTGVFVSEPVHTGAETITYVAHDADGDWQLLGESMRGGNAPVVVCFHHLIDADPSLKELADLPKGWQAERAMVGDPWIRRKFEAETERSASQK